MFLDFLPEIALGDGPQNSQIRFQNLILNPYPVFLRTITERVFWKKIQIRHW